MDRPLLICYDGSDSARCAIAAAASAYPRGQQAIVLNVWTAPLPPDVAYAGFAPVVPDADAYERQERVTTEHAEQLAADGARLARQAGFEAEPLTVKKGDSVAKTIATVAEGTSAAAIVTGTRGRSAVKGMLLGSVTLGLLHEATVPLMIVPAAARAVTQAA